VNLYCPVFFDPRSGGSFPSFGPHPSAGAGSLQIFPPSSRSFLLTFDKATFVNLLPGGGFCARVRPVDRATLPSVTFSHNHFLSSIIRRGSWTRHLLDTFHSPVLFELFGSHAPCTFSYPSRKGVVGYCLFFCRSLARARHRHLVRSVCSFSPRRLPPVFDVRFVGPLLVVLPCNRFSVPV